MAKILVKPHNHYWEDGNRFEVLAKQHKDMMQNEGKSPEDQDHLFWMRRLSRVAFISRMMSIEALANIVLDYFGIESKFTKIDKILDSFPKGETTIKLPDSVKKRKKTIRTYPIRLKIYIAPYLCNNDSRMIYDEYFEYESEMFRKFRSLIKIRNDFIHAREVSQTIEVHKKPIIEPTRAGNITGLIFDDFPENFYADVRICKDPISFDVENALTCNDILKEIIVRLNYFLKERILTKGFWDQERIVF